MDGGSTSALLPAIASALGLVLVAIIGTAGQIVLSRRQMPPPADPYDADPVHDFDTLALGLAEAIRERDLERAKSVRLEAELDACRSGRAHEHRRKQDL